MEPESTSFRVLMFPWLAHGHIFPFLELAKRILKRKRRAFHVYFCSTPVNFGSIKKFIDKNSLSDCVELVELHLEPSPELPPHFHTTKNLPENLTPALIKAFQTSRFSFSDIVTALNPDLVIYDAFQPWASKIASAQGIPAVYFCTIGAMPLSFMHHRHTFGEADFPFPAIHFEDCELKNVDAEIEFLYANIFDADDTDFFFGNVKESCDVVLVKTSKGVEGKYIDYLTDVCHKTLIPIGPLVSDDIKNDGENSDIIEWLSQKNPNSTLFISFGSEYFLSKAEIGEIAKAIELCDVNVIWIIRHPVGVTVNLDEVLPEGFRNRIGDRARIVTGWAPQADILAHRNTGGFVSHCGWNSVTESMYFGVPVIAMPMKADQPLNAKMLTEIGCCVEVRRDRGDRYKGDGIANAIKKVFSEGSGDELRRRAREVSRTMRDEKEQVLDDAAEQLEQIRLKHKHHETRN